jgi:hypothetical protein
MPTINQVISSWSSGVPRGTTNLVTDGDRLWSYGELIAFTSEEGRKVVIEKTAKSSGGFVSVTTSRHVNAAFRYCKASYAPAIMMHPTVFDNLDIERKLAIRPFLGLTENS